MDELELEAIIAEAETSTNVAWLRRTLVEVAGELQNRVVREPDSGRRSQQHRRNESTKPQKADSAR